MTTQSTSTPEPIGEALKAIDAALDEVCRINNERWNGKTGWRMSIPADPKRDSDLIIADALQLARATIRSSLPTAPAAPAPERIRVILDREHNVEVEISPVLGVSLDMLTQAFAAALKRRDKAAAPAPVPAAPLPGGADLREAARKVCDEATTGSTASDYSQRVGATCSLVPTKLIEALDRALSSLSPVPAAEGGHLPADAWNLISEALHYLESLHSGSLPEQIATTRLRIEQRLLKAHKILGSSLLVPAPSNQEKP